MSYYEVFPRDISYRPDNPLIYAYNGSLEIGSLVEIPLKEKVVVGFVGQKVNHPKFSTREIVNAFPDLPPLPEKMTELLFWLHEYYPGPMGAVIKQFFPKKIVLSDSSGQKPKSSKNLQNPPLTEEQIKIIKAIDRGNPNLLHGDTGSGKTRIYTELTAEALQKNKSALILTPEISLTSQLTASFKALFGDKVVLVHSGLTEKERLNSWLRIISNKEALVVLGPRSALFSPITNLGLIVVDEEHEEAYKQEQPPYYHTIRVAGKLANLHKATMIMGSATPSVVDYYIAERKKIPILRMKEMAVTKEKGELEIKIVNMADSSQLSRNPYLSNELLGAISKALDNKEQVLLFLNRRGTARIVLCENCGWRYLCPRCDLPLVYHGDSHNMRCHTCGFVQPALTACPICYKDQILFKGMGTKALAELIQKLYPDAVVRRFDTDNKKADRLEQNFEDIKSGKIDILIGTQTIVKGLDLPRLSVIGVVLAESGLSFPDYTASEKTYQLLTQVIGRVGRGHRAGRAIIQTYGPTNSVIEAVVKRNWKEFYNTEIAERERFLFPPFCYLLKVYTRRANRTVVARAANDFIGVIEQKKLKIQIQGPTPSFYEKVDGKYQWQIVFKAKERKQLIEVIKYLPSGWSHNIDPINLL